LLAISSSSAAPEGTALGGFARGNPLNRGYPMSSSSPSQPVSDPSPSESPTASKGVDERAAPPRVREKAEQGERRPQASWGERLRSIGTLFKETGAQWSDDEASRLAAALALYTMLSIAPLLVIAVAVAGMVFGADAARGQISQELGSIVGPQAGQAIQGLVANANTPTTGVVSTIVSIGVVLLGASGVFGELQAALNKIWEVKPKPGRGIRGLIRDRFFSFAMVMGVAFLLLVSLVVSAALAGVSGYFKGVISFPLLWEAFNFVFSLAVTSVMFALIFKLVPDVKIAWRDVWVGGFATALAFSIGRIALAWYVGRSATVSPFGAAGSLVALIVWVYYSAQILFMGAEFAQVYATRYGSRIVPTSNAVPIDAAPPEKSAKAKRAETGAPSTEAQRTPAE
jgi:membrane protein